MKQPTTLLLAALLLPLLAHSDTLHGHVVGVTDGDTTTLMDATNIQHKIRVAGIDAPEKEQSLEDRRLYAAAEDAARGKRVGLWSNPNPVPPWDYRKEKRNGGE